MHFKGGAKFALGSNRFDPSETAQLHVEQLNLDLEPKEIARSLSDTEGLCVLVGNWTGSGAIIAWDPVFNANVTEDPFSVLDQVQSVRGKQPGAVGGGWIGHIGYQAGRLIEQLPPQPKTIIPLPQHSLGYYDHLLRFDQSTRNWYFEALLTRARSEEIFLSRDRVLAKLHLSGRVARSSFEVGEFIATPTQDDHVNSVKKAIEYIGSGDIFQANITHRIEADFKGSPLELFLMGESTLKPSYAAFISRSWGSIASFSPELFIQRTGSTVMTSPIKGTAPRNSEADLDQQARSELALSEKNQAENLMIVDLMRNDLGRVCVPGSIQVDGLFDVVKMAGVWHMVSTIRGELEKNITDGELLSATFPPGSVTGAPKLRAEEIICELEHTAREAYTGSILLLSPIAGITASVVIRTFEIAAGKIWCGVGGGIVADSDPDEEYQECLTKADPILAAIGSKMSKSIRKVHSSPPGLIAIDRSAGVFETIATREGIPLDLDAHLNRLAKSSFVLHGEIPPLDPSRIKEVAAEVPDGTGRLRIVVRIANDHLETSTTCTPLDFGVSTARVEMVPMLAPGGLGEHKWCDRRAIDEFTNQNSGLLPMLIDKDQVLEASRSNLFAVIGQKIVTPGNDGRILAGITRARTIELLLSIGMHVEERDLTIDELIQASEVFLTNSLRGVESVTSCREIGLWKPGPVAGLTMDLLENYYRIQLER